MEENKNIKPEQPAENIPAGIPSVDEKNTVVEPPITNLPSEILANEDPKLQTEEMEVHHHTHPTHGKKNWKTYFWEFLMLFLAVFCGFLAEYQLEQTIERHREKDYMVSLVRDLKNDTLGINNALKAKLERIAIADSIFEIFEKKDFQNSGARLYFFGRSLGFRTYFYPNDGTTTQLQNAGGFRLVKKSNVVDSIQSYINLLRDELRLQDLEESQTIDYRRSMSRVFDALVFNKMYTSKEDLTIKKLDFNPSLVSADKFDINDLNMKILVTKGNRLSQIKALKLLLDSAVALIELIKK